MSASFEVNVPDVGEGVAEVELVSWQVEVGQAVRRREIVAEVMTDKATVEVPSPVDGTIAALGGNPGDVLAVGSRLFSLDVQGPSAVEDQPDTAPAPMPSPIPAPLPTAGAAPRTQGQRPTSTPAVRRRARQAGVDLRRVAGSGPAGRITHDDLDRYMAAPSTGQNGSSDLPPTPSSSATRSGATDQPIVGLRRKIAERMVVSAQSIPHITYVEEVDVTALEELRSTLNQDAADSGQPRLTLLPFLIRAITNSVPAFPMMNAHVIESPEPGPDVLRLFAPVHIGVATQTPGGLVVPVLRNAEAHTPWSAAAAIAELAETARTGSAAASDLSGSTITISSLGPLGGLVTTPVLNKPETAIVGVNKIATRPVWDDATGRFVPRKIMNLSASFDHRVVDGWDAAQFVQALRKGLEQPALLFVSAPERGDLQ